MNVRLSKIGCFPGQPSTFSVGHQRRGYYQEAPRIGHSFVLYPHHGFNCFQTTPVQRVQDLHDGGWVIETLNSTYQILPDDSVG